MLCTSSVCVYVLPSTIYQCFFYSTQHISVMKDLIAVIVAGDCACFIVNLCVIIYHIYMMVNIKLQICLYSQIIKAFLLSAFPVHDFTRPTDFIVKPV